MNRADIPGVRLSREEMIRVVERDKGLGVPGSLEEAGGILDPNHGVDGRVSDEEGATELGHRLGQVACLDRFEEPGSHSERTSRQNHGSSTVAADRIELPPNRARTCEGEAGAPIVATAFTVPSPGAAASTAAPPKEWPMRIFGPSRVASM